MTEKENLIRHKEAVQKVYSKINEAIHNSEFSELLSEQGTQDNMCAYSMAGYSFRILARHTDTSTIFRTYVAIPINDHTSNLEEIVELEMITSTGSSIKFRKFTDTNVYHDQFAEKYFDLILHYGVSRFKDVDS